MAVCHTHLVLTFIQSNNHKITLVVWTVTTSDKDWKPHIMAEGVSVVGVA